MDARTAYRSAFRNQRAPADAPTVQSVRSPVGARSSTTAADQARALRKPAMPVQYMSGAGGGGGGAPAAVQPAMGLPSMFAFQQLQQPQQQMVRGAYGQAGFEGVQKAFGDDWWTLPDTTRVQMLEGARRT